MSISGNLKTMDLAELFQWLSQSRKTGTLLIDNGQVQKRIFFKDGRIVSSAATDPKEYLGHFLVSQGLIDEVTLAKAMEMQEGSKMLLGKILVTIGAIDEGTLEQVLRLKVEETIYEIFTWNEGEFSFQDGELPDMAMVPVAIDVTGLILEGVKRLDEWKQIRSKIPSMQCVPVRVADLEVESEESGTAKILELVDDDRTIEELAMQTHSSELFVCRILNEQILLGRLKMVRPRILSFGTTEGEPEDKIAPEALLQRAETLLSHGDFSGTLRHLRAARSLEPDSSEIHAATERAEGKIREQIEKAGIRLAAVPELEREPEDLSSLNLTSQEGFILTRINGTYDLQTILKISPMPPLDAQLVVWRLMQAGLIKLRD